MSLWRTLRRFARAAVPPAIFLGLSAYFVWNSVQGERGLLAFEQRQALLAQRRADVVKAEAERDAWEARVRSLRGDRIDRDLLDERARAMLNLVDPQDVILQYGPREKLFGQ
jgi:cell division protein FtsB